MPDMIFRVPRSEIKLVHIAMYLEVSSNPCGKVDAPVADELQTNDSVQNHLCKFMCLMRCELHNSGM